MKSFKLSLFILTITCMTISCSKGGEETGQDCEDTHLMKVTYTNTGSIPLKIEVATQLTPQYAPINPVVSLILAPGATVVKEFIADQYFLVWSRDCPSNCSIITSYQKVYVECNEYEEKRGI